MSMVMAEVVGASSFSLPDAHGDAISMAGLALAAAKITGFENIGVPLCVTVEAEALGVEIDLGDAITEPRAGREPFGSLSDVVIPELPQLLQQGRVPIVVEAVRILAKESQELPICVNLIGPASLVAALVEPTSLLRELRTKRNEFLSLSQRIVAFLNAWTTQLLDAGADVVVVHEDTLTPALVGPKAFAELVAPALRKLSEHTHNQGALAVLHMCGSLGKSMDVLPTLGFDAYVPDAAIDPEELTRAAPELALIGNIGTFLLHKGDAGQLALLAERLALKKRLHAISPACGMASTTPLANIWAVTQTITSLTGRPEEN